MIMKQEVNKKELATALAWAAAAILIVGILPHVIFDILF